MPSSCARHVEQPPLFCICKILFYRKHQVKDGVIYNLTWKTMFSRVLDLIILYGGSCSKVPQKILGKISSLNSNFFNSKFETQTFSNQKFSRLNSNFLDLQLEKFRVLSRNKKVWTHHGGNEKYMRGVWPMMTKHII